MGIDFVDVNVMEITINSKKPLTKELATSWFRVYRKLENCVKQAIHVSLYLTGICLMK